VDDDEGKDARLEGPMYINEFDAPTPPRHARPVVPRRRPVTESVV